MKVHINDMIIFKGGDPGSEYGLSAAYTNHMNGRQTMSEDMPLAVRYIKEERKFLVVDGYHRIVKGLLEGRHEFDCVLDWKGKHERWIPPIEHRFVLENYLNKTYLDM